MNTTEKILLTQVGEDSYTGKLERGTPIFSGLPQPFVWWKRYSYARRAVLQLSEFSYYYKGLNPKTEVTA